MGILRSRRAVVSALALTASVLGHPVAHASAASTIYVGTTGCIDSGTGAGSQATPFCTVQEAANVVAAGQTILIGAGSYPAFTVSASGTATAPITITAAVPYESFEMTAAGVTVSGASYVNLTNLQLQSTTSSQVTISQSSHITFDSSNVLSGSSNTTVPAVHVTGGSSDVTISRDQVRGGFGPMIGVDGGGTGTVVTTDFLFAAGRAPGVLVSDAPQTTVAGDSIVKPCGTGIGIADGSTGASIQDNEIETVTDCPASAGPAVGLQVDSGSVPDTSADYDTVTVSAGGTEYAWAGSSYTTSPAFHTATGQGTHNLDTFTMPDALIEGGTTSTSIDSANADAPGELSTDVNGNPRVDDLLVPNTGAGAQTYYDRGAVETQPEGESVDLQESGQQDPVGGAVTFTSTVIDAWNGIPSCDYDFGDGVTGSVTSSGDQCTITHAYAMRGKYTPTVKMITAYGGEASAQGSLITVGTPPLLSVDFNGDGNTDIAGIDANNDMKLYVGNGSGQVTDGGYMWPKGGQWAGFKLIVAGDFNSDGKTDIAGIDANNDLKLYVGDGHGHLTDGGYMWPKGGQWAGFKQLVAGDFNNDGNIDIAGIDANNDLKLYLGDGNGHLTDGGYMWPVGGAWAGFKHLAAGNFTGEDDIVGIDANNDLKGYEGDGQGRLNGTSWYLWPKGGQWAGFKQLVAGNFNNDAWTDIAGVDANNDLKLYPGTNVNLTNGGYMWPSGGQWAGFKLLV